MPFPRRPSLVLGVIMRSKTRMFLGSASLALAAGFLSVAPVACAGGAGGLGLGIATIGVSAVFAGFSPGWCVRDPNQLPTDGQPVSATATPEGDIVLAAGESVDRAIVAGGAVFSPIVARGMASGGPGTSLRAELLFDSWDAGTSFAPIATAEQAIGATPQAFNLVLDFSTIVDTQANLRIANAQSNPGDFFRVRFTAVGGPLTILTTALDAGGSALTRIDYTSGQTRVTRFELNAVRAGFSATEDFAATATPITPSSVPVQFARLGPAQVDTGPGQPATFAVQVVDALQQPVSGVRVEFVADGGGLVAVPHTAFTDGQGVADTVYGFPQAGSAGVSALAFDGIGQLIPGDATWTVTVRSMAVRPNDDLNVFEAIGPAGTSRSADARIDLNAVSSFMIGTAGTLTKPTSIEYFFAKDVTSGAQWALDILFRTESPELSAQAQFEVQIFQLVGGSTVGQPVATSGPLTAVADLVRHKAAMIHGRDFSVSGPSGTPGGFRIVLLVLGSSDPARPGIEVVMDDRGDSNESFVTCPGPVVFADFSGVRILASQPDPRR